MRPKVWRRVLVPESTTLARLHTILQITMGWHDSHLHEFVIDDEHYGSPDLGESGDRVASAPRVRIADLVRRGVKKFVYTDDFGDGWEHTVTLERATVRLPGQPAVECVGGATRVDRRADRPDRIRSRDREPCARNPQAVMVQSNGAASRVDHQDTRDTPAEPSPATNA